MRAPVDLHPDDRAARLALRDELIKARQAQHLTQADVARRLGVRENTIGALELGESWRMSRIQRLAWAARRRIVFRVADLDGAFTEGIDLFRPADAEKADVWDQAALIDDMVSARIAARVTQIELGRRLGIAGKVVSTIERHKSGLLLITPQRYLRALGGRLDISVEAYA